METAIKESEEEGCEIPGTLLSETKIIWSLLAIGMASPVVNVPIPRGLKDALKEAAKRMGCSQGEIIRIALWKLLEDLNLIKDQIHKTQE